MSKSAPTVKATVILAAAAIDKLIVSIKGRGAKLDADIHQAAISALDHHAKHGDITLFNRLVSAMPKSGRTNALVAWALAMGGNVAKNPVKDVTATLVHDKASEARFDFDKADATPFWEFKAQEGVSVFAFDTYITSLTKGIKRAMGEANVSEEQRAVLEGMLTAATVAPRVIGVEATAE